MIDINNLGTFSDINAVWAEYPEGGNEGDYLYIGTTKYRWDKYERVWKTAGEVTESPARKLVTNYGDMAVNNDLRVGGTLYYHRLAGYDLGLFSSSTALSTAHPTPKVGQWAFVVHPEEEEKYQIYTCSTAGTWTLSVSETTLDIMGFDKYEETLEAMQQIANGRALTGYRAVASLSDLPADGSSDPTLGWLCDGHLYVWVGTGGDTLDGKYQDCGKLKGDKGDKGDKGNDGVVLDPEAVSIFDELSDLDGKTDEQKQAMLPDGMAVEEAYSHMATERIERTIGAGTSITGQFQGHIDYRYQYQDAVTVTRIVFSKEYLDKVVNRQTKSGQKCFACNSSLKITQVVTFTLAADSYEADFDDELLQIPAGGYLGFYQDSIGVNSSNTTMYLMPFVNTGTTSNPIFTYWCINTQVVVGTTLANNQKQQYITGYTVYVKDYANNTTMANKADIEELQAIVGRNSVGVTDATNCLILGSSLTDDYHSPQGLGWCDRLNDLVDVNIVNGGWTGTTLIRNIELLQKGCIQRDYTNEAQYRKIPYKIDYVWYGNTANSTPVGSVATSQFMMGKKVADMLGAKMLIGTENPMTYSGLSFDQHRKEYGRKNNVAVSAVSQIASKLKIDSPYVGFSSGVHGGYRSNAFFIVHYDLLSRLAIKKNVKLFRVRPDYRGGSPTVAQLAYDGNVERARYFTAIAAGCGAYPTTGAADNRDSSSYNVPSSTAPTLVQEEFTILKGGALNFDTYCLAEFILDRLHILQATFSAEVSVEPTAVYILTKKTAYSGTCSEWVEITTDKKYADGIFTVNIYNRTREIEAFDKVRILLYYSEGEFTLNKPTLSNYDGTVKVADDLMNGYHHRQYGTELNTKTSCEEGWTLTNAEVKALPTEIANYSGYNNVKSHVELLSDSATMVKTVDVNGANRVAIRVVANLFPKIATTRTFSTMTEEQKAEYISDDAPTVVERGYNYGTLYLGVNNAVYEEFLMQPGWLEYYTEVDLTGETSIPITIGRKNAVDGYTTNSDFKVLIHDVSVQKIG